MEAVGTQTLWTPRKNKQLLNLVLVTAFTGYEAPRQVALALRP